MCIYIYLGVYSKSLINLDDKPFMVDSGFGLWYPDISPRNSSTVPTFNMQLAVIV